MLKCSTLTKIKYFCEKIHNFFKINRHNFHHEGRGVEDTGDHFHLTSIIDPTNQTIPSYKQHKNMQYDNHQLQTLATRF